MKRLLAFLSCLAVAFYAGFAVAADDPAALVGNTSEQVRVSLQRENGKNTAEIRKEVEDILFPRFDFTRMTALAVGKFWREASPAQKDALTAEFRTLLTNTYFNTMLRYREAKITIKPDVIVENDGKQATVKSDVLVPNAQSGVAIDYVLYNTDQGWKVFNVNVEGASLVTVYRNQFGEEIGKSGLDGLVQSLHAKNQTLATAAPAATAAAGK